MMGSSQNWLATAITEHCLGEGVGVWQGGGGLVVLGMGVPVERFLGAGLCASEVGVKCVSG